MTEPGNLDYLAVFAVTCALTLFLTPLALRFALRGQILDHPSEIKAQSSPVPYLGGVAIVVSFAAVVLAAALLKPPNSGLGELALILGLGVMLAILGLVDDLKGLSPWLRLSIEGAAGVTVWGTPAGAEVFGNDALNLVVTVLWIVGVTNAFNLLDNMDGLSGGVAAIGSGVVVVLAVNGGQFLVATLAIALAGCAVGFLRSNFHPARIYMGDAGALFIGFLLAVLCLKLRFPDAPKLVGLFVPVLVLGIALFDTTLVSVTRIIHRKNPFSGGRDHVSHRLVFIGVPVPVAVALIYIGAASLGCLAFILSRADSTAATVLITWVLAVATVFGVLLSLVPVYETSTRRLLMLRQVLQHEAEPPAAIVHEEPESA